MSNQSSSASQSDSGSQSISISVGSNSGQIQAANAGRDAVLSQNQGGAAEAPELTQDEAVALLAQVVALIQAADLPEAEKEEAGMYAKLAQREAAKAEPDKQRVVGNLEGAIKLLKNMSETAEAGKKLVGNLKGPVVKLGGWLGKLSISLLTYLG